MIFGLFCYASPDFEAACFLSEALYERSARNLKGFTQTGGCSKFSLLPRFPQANSEEPPLFGHGRG